MPRVIEDVDAWFAELDRLGGANSFDFERSQPPAPPAQDLFD